MKNNLIASEHDIQSMILTYLNDIGIYAWRSNAGRYPVGEGSTRRMIIGAPAGTPDILGICGSRFKNGKYFGRLMGVEIKRPGKTTTAIQNYMLRIFVEHGAFAFIIHSLDEIRENLKKL